ncbi:uncharacterized protein LOC129595566 isoform X2 [Paramacrobiotus metropolitanus]|uniref:uncharacterized protein LOC129595566 isoform X2 n=1 Tax=Paramacrobiotus metropolitanus TaxID=2943436 RepID=UPI002446083C|nr:uncharacterized protein LOC129595566 isoform X2 [Paramacrobiotus metropolitanus]
MKSAACVVQAVLVLLLFAALLKLTLDFWRSEPAEFTAAPPKNLRSYQIIHNPVPHTASPKPPDSGPPSTVSLPRDHYLYDNPIPDIVSNIVIPEGNGHLPVHLVRFYTDPPSGDRGSFCWTECVSILSALLYIRPTKIYIHTNHADYWPFGRCTMFSNYSMIQLVQVRRRFYLGAAIVSSIAHEADIIKYSTAYQYGGIVMDQDVFFLPKIIEDKMNAGFIACHPGQSYIKDILQVYSTSYTPSSWLYNSGYIPFVIYKNNTEYQKNFYVDYVMSNHLMEYNGPVHYKDIPAWHSFNDWCEKNEENSRSLAVNSSYWEMVHFILKEEQNRKYFLSTTTATAPSATPTAVKSSES